MDFGHGVEGSYGAGFALGFFAGVIGLILGLLLGKPKLKKGAVHGFLVSLGLSIVVIIFYFVVISQFLALFI